MRGRRREVIFSRLFCVLVLPFNPVIIKIHVNPLDLATSPILSSSVLSICPTCASATWFHMAKTSGYSCKLYKSSSNPAEMTRSMSTSLMW